MKGPTFQKPDDFETRVSRRGSDQSAMTVKSVPRPLYAVVAFPHGQRDAAFRDVRKIFDSLDDTIRWCSGDPSVPFGNAAVKLSELPRVEVYRLAVDDRIPRLVWIHKNPAGEHGEPRS